MKELSRGMPLKNRKLENFKKIPEMVGFKGKYPVSHPKAKFLLFLVRNRKKSAAKHSLEKPILLKKYQCGHTI